MAIADPAEEVLATLTAYHEAERAEDVERMLAAFSEDFSNSQGTTKPLLRAYFEGLVAEGNLPGLGINMEDCRISVEGDSAAVGPVIYGSLMGGTSYVYRLKREADGIWRIVNSEQAYGQPDVGERMEPELTDRRKTAKLWSRSVGAPDSDGLDYRIPKPKRFGAS